MIFLVLVLDTYSTMTLQMSESNLRAKVRGMVDSDIRRVTCTRTWTRILVELGHKNGPDRIRIGIIIGL